MKLRRFVKDFTRETKGIASLEFALILIPMCIVFFGMLQWGLIMYHFNEMGNVAREAVREMAINDDMQAHSAGAQVACPGAAGSVEQFACSLLGVQAAGGIITACYQQDVLPPDDPVFNAVVTIQADMDIMGGFFDFLGIADGNTVTTSADMRVEPEKISSGGFEPQLCDANGDPGGGPPQF